jgi:tryptophan synthase beta chain
MGNCAGICMLIFDLECEVWQVGGSYDLKPYRRLMMEVFGAVVHRSPSQLTEAGRKLALDPKE